MRRKTKRIWMIAFLLLLSALFAAAALSAPREHELSPAPQTTESAAPLTPPPVRGMAAAYKEVLSDCVGRHGVSAGADGNGLAYAQLSDFDGDGADELYLYYVDRDPGGAVFHPAYSWRDAVEYKYLHEEIWRWNGAQAVRCYSNCISDAANSRNCRRWLVQHGGRSYLAWSEENSTQGAANKVLEIYGLSEGTVQRVVRACALFAPANALKGLYGERCWEIQKAYGIHSLKYTTTYYLYYGELDTPEGIRAYDFESCVAVLDKDSMEMTLRFSADGEDPVTLINAFEAMPERRLLVYADSWAGGNNGALEWAKSDAEALIARLENE